MDCYQSTRRLWEPDFHVDRTEGDYADRWSTASRLLVVGGDPACGPEPFVAWTCLRYEGDRQVYVNLITSEKTVREFREDVPERRRRLRLAMFLQADQIQEHLRRGDRLMDILADASLSIGPVVRFSAAWSRGLGWEARKFREAAKDLLFWEPLYDEVLGRWLPEDMSHERIKAACNCPQARR